MMQQFVISVKLNVPFDLFLTQKLIILGILSKLNLPIKELKSITFPVYLKINLLLLLFLLILKIMYRLLFVISTINIFVVLY